MAKKKHNEGNLINGLFFIKELDLQVFPASNPARIGLFKCYCGNSFKAQVRNVVSGITRSCGCLAIAVRTTHGKSKHPLYLTWGTMKARCYNKNRPDYKYYGGKDIVMSEEFKNDFSVWLEYVEQLPNYELRQELKLTIDRIEPGAGYERGNLRWATHSQQCNNFSNNRIITLNGVSKTISEWADVTAIPYATIYARIGYGWSIEKTLTTPLLRKNNTELLITEYSVHE
jgi:hypothetical protein